MAVDVCTRWTDVLVDHSLGDFATSDAIDRRLSALAIDARTSHESSNTLFGMLSTKSERFARRYRYWSIDPWEYDDVLQESYFIFLDTVKRWKPRYESGEPVGYLYYFLAVFRFWLSGRVSQLAGRRRPLSVEIPDDYPAHGEGAHCEEDGVVAAAIAAIRARLDPEARLLFDLKISTGKSVTDAGKIAGMSRRTAYRRWSQVVRVARDELSVDRLAA